MPELHTHKKTPVQKNRDDIAELSRQFNNLKHWLNAGVDGQIIRLVGGRAAHVDELNVVFISGSTDYPITDQDDLIYCDVNSFTGEVDLNDPATARKRIITILNESFSSFNVSSSPYWFPGDVSTVTVPAQSSIEIFPDNGLWHLVRTSSQT